MKNETIKNLLDALALSPDNIPLRLHIAGLMLQDKMYTEASEQFKLVLDKSYGHIKAQSGLAECYYHLQKFSAASIIYEQLRDNLNLEDQVRYIKCLLKDNALQQAVDLYQRIIAVHPNFKDEEIDSMLRLPSQSASVDDVDEDGTAKYFMQKPKIKFSDVGGMKRVKEEIEIKIIQPLKNPDLYKAFGKKIGGGILLYGPPGCGKTFIAKATAGEIDAKFINIGLHDILDMWIGNSEKNLHEIFELARKNAPCVLFFDEVDAMGASRSDLKGSAMRHVINQFLAEMDGIESDNEGVLILAATNAPWSVDAAFRRPGRFDRIIMVEPPDVTAREEMLRTMLHEKPVAEIDVPKIAQATEGYSGADLKAVIDMAVEEKLRESMQKGTIQPIGTKDLLKATKGHRPTTTEWFATARNYALYANESGLYDDILMYIKIKKKKVETGILLDRAELLLEQGRHSDAQKNVRQALELDPENDHALSLLCRCHYATKQYTEGIAIILQAISLDPNNSFYFYLLAFGYYQQDNSSAAVENLNKAIRLNPYNSEYYGLMAYVLLQQNAFEKALNKADEGLAVDAANITCLNARSIALNKLKRTDAAIETMQHALAQDPDNEMTHATVGWNLLEKGKSKEATKHFLEALRISPNHSNAKSGLKEALKSKVPPYRWLLQYSFWVNNKGKKFQAAVPFVLYIVFRLLISAFSSTNHTGLAWLFGGIYILIVVTSWTINSIANFFLLFHPVGKYALTVTEKWSAITVVTAFVTGIAVLCLSQLTPLFSNTIYNDAVFGAGLVCLSLALPLSEIEYPLHLKNIRGWRGWYAFSLALFGIVTLAIFALLPQQALVFFLIYGLAFIIYNWTGIGRR